MAIDGLPRVYKLSDVAERWDCSQNHIRKLVESGELRAFRVGSLWRIRAEAVDEFEARPAVSPPSPQPAPKEDPNPALTRLRRRNLRKPGELPST